MPDLSKCKYVGGKLYCWDRIAQCFVEVTVTPIDISQSQKLIAAFIEGGAETAGGGGPA